MFQSRSPIVGAAFMSGVILPGTAWASVHGLIPREWYQLLLTAAIIGWLALAIARAAKKVIKAATTQIDAWGERWDRERDQLLGEALVGHLSATWQDTDTGHLERRKW